MIKATCSKAIGSDFYGNEQRMKSRTRYLILKHPNVQERSTETEKFPISMLIMMKFF